MSQDHTERCLCPTCRDAIDASIKRREAAAEDPRNTFCSFCGAKCGADDCGKHKKPGPPQPPRFFPCCGGPMTTRYGVIYERHTADCPRHKPAEPAPAPEPCLKCGKPCVESGLIHVDGWYHAECGPDRIAARLVTAELRVQAQEAELAQLRKPAAPAAPPDNWPENARLLLHGIYPRYFETIPGAHLTEDEAVQFAEEYARLKVKSAEAELEPLRQQVQEQESARQNYAKELAQLRQQRDFWQIEESRCKESLMRLETERAGLRERVQSLEALRQYTVHRYHECLYENTPYGWTPRDRPLKECRCGLAQLEAILREQGK